MQEPWAARHADVEKAIQAENATQNRCGFDNHHPTAAHIEARLRAIAAGEIAGAQDKFGGMGAQLSRLAAILEMALNANQEAAAKLLEEQNQGPLEMARGRRNVRHRAPA